MDDDIICIEDSTICSPTPSSSRRRSSPIQIADERDFDERMSELDALINKQKSIFNRDARKRQSSPIAIDTSKRLKQIEKEKKTQERQQKKDEKQREKDLKRIEREIAASMNSKTELFSFCHIGRQVVDRLPELKQLLAELFKERKIENQWNIDDSCMDRIVFKRKVIDINYDEDNKPVKAEFMINEDLFAKLVDSSILKDIILSNSIENFIREEKYQYDNLTSKIILLSFGPKLSLPKKKLHQLSIRLFDEHGCQIVHISDCSSLALFCAQCIRSFGKKHKTVTDGDNSHLVQYLGQKGVVNCGRNEMVADWWDKMLDTVARLSDAQRRAILQFIPDPMDAMDKYSKMDYDDAIDELSNIVAENGRRIGHVMAHRILTMLTDTSGQAIID